MSKPYGRCPPSPPPQNWFICEVDDNPGHKNHTICAAFFDHGYYLETGQYRVREPYRDHDLILWDRAEGYPLGPNIIEEVPA